jgi:Uncharacterized protein conserved in bacteria
MDNLSYVTQDYLRQYYAILSQMVDNMMNVPESNSISRNFILQMIPHHEAAIEMSRNLLQYTTNEDLQDIALDIIVTEGEGVEAMQRALNRCSTITNDNNDILNYQRAYQAIIRTSVDAMINVQMGDNIDLDYINAMIPQQEGAISMAKNALRFNVCREVKGIIDAIIIFQSREVMRLKMLKNRIENSLEQ